MRKPALDAAFHRALLLVLDLTFPSLHDADRSSSTPLTQVVESRTVPTATARSTRTYAARLGRTGACLQAWSIEPIARRASPSCLTMQH